MQFTPFICVARKKVERAKEDKSKHHGAANKSISEQERFDRTDMTFAFRKYGGHIHSG